MKKFSYKLTPYMLCLYILGFVLAIAGIVLNIVRLVNNPTPTVNNYISFGCIVVICAAFLFLGIAIIFNSYYQITDTDLVLKWGVLKNVIELKTINRLVKFTKGNKLVVYYNDDHYFVIFISQNIYEDFIAALLKTNESIVLDIIDNEKKEDTK